MGSIHPLLQGITTFLRSNCSSFLNCIGKCENPYTVAFPLSCPWICLALENSHVFLPEKSSFMLFSGSSPPVMALLVSSLLLERPKPLSFLYLVTPSCFWGSTCAYPHICSLPFMVGQCLQQVWNLYIGLWWRNLEIYTTAVYFIDVLVCSNLEEVCEVRFVHQDCLGKP